MLVAERVADGDDRLADHEVRRRAQPDHRQRLGRVDLDQREVGLLVGGDDAGGVPGAVVQSHAEGADVVHDVEVGQHVPAAVEHDAGAHAVDPLRLYRLAVERVFGRRVDRGHNRHAVRQLKVHTTHCISCYWESALFDHEIYGGGGGIRTHEAFRPAGFQDRSHQPLDHPSWCFVMSFNGAAP